MNDRERLLMTELDEALAVAHALRRHASDVPLPRRQQPRGVTAPTRF